MPKPAEVQGKKALEEAKEPRASTVTTRASGIPTAPGYTPIQQPPQHARLANQRAPGAAEGSAESGGELVLPSIMEK